MADDRIVIIEWRGRRRRRREVILELNASGGSVGEIARLLGISYQTVYQVVPSMAWPRSMSTDTKSARMRVMFAAGATVAHVAREMQVDYAFAYGVAKRN